MLFFCCALPCEAEPIIKRYSLKPISSKMPFPIYQNEKIYLVISGIGKILTAMACTMLYSQKQPATPIWLNVGVAGHRDHPLGQPFLIHKIVDDSRKCAFYPSFAFTSPCSTEVLTTVETPEIIFAENTLYDMEGSGFHDAARRFSPLELIHCFKIVSDNLQSSSLSKAEIAQSIAKQLDLLDVVIQSLLQLQKQIISLEETDSPDLTFTEKAQWKDLVRQSQALQLPIPETPNKESLKKLKALVESHVPTYLY